ncbi:MAG: MFS transporter [Deltaproteobacteria bacterium]|nr:MFS transporter [Deltaproteobacteria bacterium]
MAVPQLSNTTKLWYGLGQAAEGIKSTSFAAFLLFYYTQVLGLSGTAVGIVIFIALLCDAITDPMAGMLSDRLQSRWGRRHPFMYAAALPLAIFYYFLFTPPEGLSQIQLALWLLLFTLLARTAMTAYSVPHLSLGAELSSDYDDRTSIVAVRSFMGLGGGIVAGLVGLGYFMRSTPEYPNGQLNPEAYPAFAFVFAIAIFVTITASGIGTHSRIRYLPAGGSSAQVGLLEELRYSLHNHSFRALFIGATIFAVIIGVQGVLGLHMGTYFWQLDTRDIFHYTIAAGAGVLCGLPVWTAVARRYDKKPTFLFGVIWFAAFASLPPLFRVLDWLPEPGTRAYIGFVVSAGFLMAFGAAAASATLGSMMADITDEDALITGRRREGIYFGALSFSAKTATGLGQLLGGVLVDTVGLTENVDVGGISPQIVTDLGLFYAVGTAVLASASIYFLARYRLDRERHAEIRSALEERDTEYLRSL